MTKRNSTKLYHQDSYLREFDAQILEVRNTGKGKSVLLDRTAFYPESGGQPADRGFLDQASVLDVQENEQGEILHHLDTDLPVGRVVHGRLDWTRRYDHMQQHTGQHLLSESFLQEARANTLSFHLGKESSTIDLDIAVVDQDLLNRVLMRVQSILFENRPIRTGFFSVTEVASLPLRKSPVCTEEIRIVEIEGYDWSACCGTHLRSLGELGTVLITQTERYKGGTRIEFLCGWRAWYHSLGQQQLFKDVCRRLSSSATDMPAAIEHLQETNRTSEQQVRDLRAQLQKYQAEELWNRAGMLEGGRIIRTQVNVGSMEQLKFLALEIMQKGPCLVLLAGSGPAGMMVAASSLPGLQEIGKPFQQTLAQFGGRGGGKGPIAQGGGFPTEQTTQLLQALHQALTLAQKK
jgi:alanyl-tRNA synthetase